MIRIPANLKKLVAFVGVVALVACSVPTAPSPVSAKKIQLTRNNDGQVPCDSTIVTDGTCRGGWIIPW